MDALKAELAAKRKAKEAPPPADEGGSSASGNTAEPPAKKKWVKRGDILKQQEEASRREQEEKARAKAAEERLKEEERRARRSRSKTPRHDDDNESKEAAGAAVKDAQKESFNIAPEEAVRRLRARGEPIRLFGETDKERRLRLRALELIEERGARVGQNDFMKALQGAETTEAKKAIERMHHSDKGKSEQERAKEAEAAAAAAVKAEAEAQDKGKAREGVGMNSLLDLDLIRTDENKVHPIIYYTLKGLLTDWEEYLAQRPDEVRQSAQGKLAAATQVQTASYLKPLFKQLRHRDLPSDMLLRIAEIVHFMQKRNYRKANDSYLQLSIGNAPWPIGATSVGIHARSGREKIFSSKIAHVLNDEETRKYIQSLKRLMTFAQTKYPPDDVSMLMG